eukprot:CAMPEP_0196219236 /NCGR_PEP_ID=MMETSP0912-20130531/38427_1 /TAXON_ID=49265 /ORGANISM="Thalassiosira rotula, Strain GSO102" /LENGTH=36 /DNA_ID= /DNA_START= /DNA_END= /DNA_ORIENTATION=
MIQASVSTTATKTPALSHVTLNAITTNTAGAQPAAG